MIKHVEMYLLACKLVRYLFLKHIQNHLLALYRQMYSNFIFFFIKYFSRLVILKQKKLGKKVKI